MSPHSPAGAQVRAGPRFVHRIAAACLGLVACRDEPFEPAGGFDLLARSPDGLTWQAGELAPGRAGWKELGQFGWERVEHEVEGRTYVWTNRDRAYLSLPACAPRDRQLVLELTAPGRSRVAVDLSLNGTFLETLQVGGEPEEHRLDVPRPLWHEGDNLLELACPLESLNPAWPPLGVGLLRLSYDQPRLVRVDVAAQSVRLEDGTSVHYRIEPLSRGRIVLAGRSPGPGSLGVTVVAIDAGTGAEGAAHTQALRVPPREDFEHLLELDGDGRLIELRLTWIPEPAAVHSQLELDRLELQEADPVGRPPIVLISVDTLSARHLSVYGYPLPTAPALERFASEAFVFEQCYSNAPWTLPSFMSLMSGLYASASQIESKGQELWERWYLASNRWTLAELLRASGYRTAGFVDNAWITAPFGFPQGFEVYDASAADNNARKHEDADGGIRQTLAGARRFLGALTPDSPFFLFVHGFDVHGPYTPPAPFGGEFDGSGAYDQERSVRAGGPANVFGIVPTYIARGEVRTGAIPGTLRSAPIEGAYDEGIRFVDHELGAFFDHLRREGWLERAWVIVTADHGETMADTPYYFGHGVMDQDVVRVPLLVRPPGGIPGGKRIPSAVQLVDLYPTVLDLLGSRDSREHLHGRSLVPLLSDQPGGSRVILSETGLMRQSMLVADGWKLVEREPSKEIGAAALLSLASLSPELLERVRSTTPRKAHLTSWRNDEALTQEFFQVLPSTGLTEELLASMQARQGFNSLMAFLKSLLEEPAYELYALAEDPGARRDVASRHPDVLVRMKALLESEKERREAARRAARPPTQPVELSAETVRDIEALGYTGKSAD